MPSILEILFAVIFITIGIFIIFPLFQKNYKSKNESNDFRDNHNDFEVLENEYNLGLIDKKQFEEEKNKLKNNNAYN